jgi:Reverse transcriptase (RNA-dependent DNA polymerase)
MVGINEERIPHHGKLGVWEVVLMSTMPGGRMVVGNRRVLTETDYGNQRSRTVSQGFSQVPGKDFTHSHAPVMTDLAFCLALIIRVLMKLCAGQYDIETAFLYTELDEKIYRRIPEGCVRHMLEERNRTIDPSTYVLLLKKAIYGLLHGGFQTMVEEGQRGYGWV